MMTEVAGTDVGVSGLPRRSSFRQSWYRQRLLALGVMLAAIGGSACDGVLPKPASEASQGQLMLDLAETLNQIRDQSASLQDQVDSLREVVYQQDTIIRKLAIGAGVPVPPVR